MEQALVQQSMRVALDALTFCEDVKEGEDDVIAYIEKIMPDIKRMVADDETFDRTITMLLLAIDFIYSMTDMVPPGVTFDDLTHALMPKEGDYDSG